MQNQWIIVGIDISKLTLDVSCVTTNEHFKTDNNKTGFKEILKWAKRKRIASENLWIVFENTGLYSMAIKKFCTEVGLRYSEVPGLAIKRSGGLSRGKNDKVDAKRICLYGMEKQGVLKPSFPYRAEIARLKTLMNMRDRLVTQRAGFVTSMKEFLAADAFEASDLIIKSHKAMVKYLTKNIEQLEGEIKRVIKENEEINRNYALVTSIVGVGFVVAVYTIIYTQNFEAFTDARKFACYCGTAPFEKQSGTSIRGKTAVSHLANKKMKSILEMAARSASQSDPESKTYYQARLAKGKSASSTLNILRNKLIARMFAVVRDNRPYEIRCAA
jgi:transposase